MSSPFLELLRQTDGRTDMAKPADKFLQI